MRAMILRGTRSLGEDREPLELAMWPDPWPGEREVVVRVTACGVCHTEIDEIEGRTPPTHYPVIPGHQIVGRVVKRGDGVSRLNLGDRVGIGWIHSACGECSFCREGRENLCPRFEATGRDAHGGYAEYTSVSEDFALRIPEGLTDVEAAPLLCAGAIGYRSLRLTGMRDGQILGLTGFGASAHLVLRMARELYPNSRIHVFARSEKEREFAHELGATWTGDTEEVPPDKVHCLIDTTPAWKPVVDGLRHLEPGGRLVINAIRKEEADQGYLSQLDYARDLWLEKEIRSVANVTRQDLAETLDLAARISLKPEVQVFGLEEANAVLMELKERKIRGAKVLRL